MTDHLLWKSEPFSKGQAWIDLLMHANFSDNEILIKGQVIRLSRGQQARSEVTLSKSWKWSRNKVRRFLELLKKEGMIVTETTHLTSIISICNYESFQGGDTAGGTGVGTGVGTAGEHLTEHSKEGKEGKEGNTSAKADSIPYIKIAELWNNTATNLPKIGKPESMSADRKKLIKRFWNAHKGNFEEGKAGAYFANYFAAANSTDFWVETQATIDTLMRPNKYENIMKG